MVIENVHSAVDTEKVTVGSCVVYADTMKELEERSKQQLYGSVLEIGEDDRHCRYIVRRHDGLEAAYALVEVIPGPVTKFVPFEHVGDVMARAKADGTLWLRAKFGKRLYIVTAVDYADDTLLLSSWFNLKDLFEEYTFEDGSPIGVEVQA